MSVGECGICFYLCIDVYSLCAYMTTIFVLYVHNIMSDFPFPRHVLLFSQLIKTPAELVVLNIVSYNEFYQM